jgi:hypothetical protein
MAFSAALEHPSKAARGGDVKWRKVEAKGPDPAAARPGWLGPKGARSESGLACCGTSGWRRPFVSSGAEEAKHAILVTVEVAKVVPATRCN